MRTVIYGTKGTLIIDNVNPTISLFKEEFSECPELQAPVKQQTVEMKIPVSVNNHNFAAEVTDFCKCLLENRPVTTDGVEGASTVAVCLGLIAYLDLGHNGGRICTDRTHLAFIFRGSCFTDSYNSLVFA